MEQEHLLLVGTHLEALLLLSVKLSGAFHTTTIAVVDDITSRAVAGWDGSLVIVSLSDDDDPDSVIALAHAVPPVLFVVPSHCSPIADELAAGGGLVVAADEPGSVVLATLHAYSQRSLHRSSNG